MENLKERSVLNGKISDLSKGLGAVLVPVREKLHENPKFKSYVSDLRYAELLSRLKKVDYNEAVLREFEKIQEKHQGLFESVHDLSNRELDKFKAKLQAEWTGYSIDLRQSDLSASLIMLLRGAASKEAQEDQIATPPYDRSETYTSKDVLDTGCKYSVETYPDIDHMAGTIDDYSSIYHVDGSAYTEGGVVKLFSVNSNDRYRVRVNFSHCHEVFAWSTHDNGEAIAVAGIEIEVKDQYDGYVSLGPLVSAATSVSGEGSRDVTGGGQNVEFETGNLDFPSGHCSVCIKGFSLVRSNCEHHSGAGASVVATISSIGLYK